MSYACVSGSMRDSYGAWISKGENSIFTLTWEWLMFHLEASVCDC